MKHVKEIQDHSGPITTGITHDRALALLHYAVRFIERFDPNVDELRYRARFPNVIDHADPIVTHLDLFEEEHPTQSIHESQLYAQVRWEVAEHRRLVTPHIHYEVYPELELEIEQAHGYDDTDPARDNYRETQEEL